MSNILDIQNIVEKDISNAKKVQVAFCFPSERLGQRLEARSGSGRKVEVHTGAAFLNR